ncbi:MAG TPA: hypothetical protein VGR96_02135 [Acidobacteriaceae bacterium]|nr:hypothetical protein [Acidobacteriaceae bacterium]
MVQRTSFGCVLLAIVLLSGTSTAQRLDTKTLRDILSKQGFSGELHGRVTFSRLGTIKCNTEELQVFYYTWEETNPPGRAVQFSRRLIFIEKQNYIGQYVISDRPVLVKPDLLRFPVSEADGNALRCDQEGLPKSAYLDGEGRTFER